MVMVCNWYSHIVRVFIADRFYREAKRVARNERDSAELREKFSLSVPAAPFVSYFRWPSYREAVIPTNRARWRRRSRKERRKQAECRSAAKRDGVPFFPRYSLKRSQLRHCSRTGFSIAIERVCSAFVKARSDPGNFLRIPLCAASSTSALSNRPYLISLLKRFLPKLRLRVLLDLHRLASKLQSCCVNDENRFLRGLLDVGTKRTYVLSKREKQILLLFNSINARYV